MAGAEGFEPPSSVLETDSLTVELTPLWCSIRIRRRIERLRARKGAAAGRPVLLGFLMCRVLAAAVAELLELETASGRLLVLRRRVVPLLAIRALQCHDFAHFFILPQGSQPACRRLRLSFPYFSISVMVPAPTVRPPSRMANLRPFSIATGVCSSISRLMLSPGITISVPAGSLAVPVTSVVRK